MSEESIRLLMGLAEASLTGKPAPPLDGETADWSLVLRMARIHRLSGLLYESVRRARPEPPTPDPIWASLYSDYYTNLARNLVLLDHCESLLGEVRRAKIPAVLLKGAAFIGWVYGDPGLRPMADLDVLIHRRDLSAAIRQAEKLAYRLYQTADHAVSLRHSGSGTHLEIHTSLTLCPRYMDLDTEAMIERSIRIERGDRPARTLAPEDHLLHLCLHAAFQHGVRQPAINACDVYLLARLPELDWKRFFQQAMKPRLAPLVYAGLGISQRVLPTAEVRAALESLEPRVPARMRRWLKRLEISRLLSASESSANGSPWSRIVWTPGIRDAWHLISETLRPGATAVTAPDSVLRRAVHLVRTHAFARRRRTPWRKAMDARVQA